MFRLPFFAAVLAFSASTGFAATLFNQTYTGAQLAADATFFGPNSVSGTSVIARNATSNGPIFSLDVLPAGSRGALNVTLDISYTGITADSDFLLGITDGVNVFSFGRIDRTAVYAGEHVRTPTVPFTNFLSSAFPRTGGAGVVTSFSNSFEIFDAGAGGTGSLTQGTSSVGFNFNSLSLDTDNALSVIAYNNGTNENYQIDSLSVLIEDQVPAVPLPASGLLLVGAFAAPLVLRRRKR